ncbi:hypothetical protein [Streptomyces sp. SS]|uniref:hypothetical protein n=1 Tax=Streptomyces sp. SS TaxID=260742 RepID=UPI0002DC0438|nr:hypothetical protein [Streptomyces sp. SS]
MPEQNPARTMHLAPELAPTPRNIASATEAYARIAAAAWRARSGYPGSDVLWDVECLLCGWTGQRFYSHLRRGRPAFRHGGCKPISEHADLIARYAAERLAPQCRCIIHHPTAPDAVAAVLEGLAAARAAADPVGIMVGLAQILGDCPAAGARAAALCELKSRTQ